MGTSFGFKALVLTVVAAIASAASAQVTPFIAEWSNTAGAHAVATFNLDLTAVNASYNPGEYNSTFAASPLSNFAITVTGAAAGNGSWVQSDFLNVHLQVANTLNPTVEWVGQAQPSTAAPWGTAPLQAHDFGIFSSVLGAPSSTFFYTLTLNNGGLNRPSLTLISFRPVPAPGAAAILGLSALASFRRRR